MDKNSQLDLLSYNPIARNSDPVSSHEAAGEITLDGTRAIQQYTVLMAVKERPGSTSRELAKHSHLTRYDFARRLPELEHAGLVAKGPMRPCKISGKRALTWWNKP
jgi:hypothetical protein